ncbi:hypothetical protein ERO13_D11G181300v2 [Gossypium hirsutum]|nr:hypothetical protein ERO13_D11G181300v2 [Gossypium hirsutum]
MGCRICPPRYKSSLKTPKLTCSLFYVLDDGTTVDLSFSADFSFRITVRASPSTHTSLKPSSFLKHALASAVVGSGMFFHCCTTAPRMRWLTSYTPICWLS